MRQRCLIALATLPLAFPAWSAPTPAPAFEDLLASAAVTAPRLLEEAALLRAAQGRARQSSAVPNPQLGLEVENILGSAPYSGYSQAQTTLSLSQPLELAGQRGARARAGRAEVDLALARVRQAQADFAYDLAVAYAAAEFAQLRARRLAEDLARSDEDLGMARALVDAGREAPLRVAQAEAAQAAAQADLALARVEASMGLAELAGLTGDPVPYTGIQSSLLSRPTALPGQVADIVPQSPAVATARAERELADHRVRVEQKRALPSLGVSAGLRKFRGDAATAWVGGVSVSLPLFDRNGGAIAASRAERDAAEVRMTAAGLEAASAWRGALAQSVAVGNRVTATDRGELASQEAYRLARIAYEAGRAPLAELLATRRALTEAQLRALDARQARVQAEATFARLSGRTPFSE